MNKTLENRICDYIKEVEVMIAGELGNGEPWEEILNGVIDLDTNLDRYKDGVKLYLDAKERHGHNGQLTVGGSVMSDKIKESIDGKVKHFYSEPHRYDAAGVGNMMAQLLMMMDLSIESHDQTKNDKLEAEILRLSALIK